MSAWLEREIVSVKESGIEEVQIAKCPFCQKWLTTPYAYCFTEYPFCPNCGQKIGKIEFVTPSLFGDDLGEEL